MDQQRISILAILSLCLAAVLAMGFTGDFGFTGLRAFPSGTTVTAKEATFSLDDGRIRFIISTYTGPPLIGMPMGFHLLPHHRLLLHLRINLWLAGFDAHQLVSGQATTWLFSVPIWCGLLPCSIAPLLWLRRQRTIEPRGFAVKSGAVLE